MAIISNDLPREMLLRNGAASLSDRDLLAIVLRTGVPGLACTNGPSVLNLVEEILAKFGSIQNVLRASALELKSIKGLGQSKVASILAISELGYRLYNNRQRLPVIREKEEAYRFFWDMAGESQEILEAAFLNSQNRVLRRSVIFRGTLTESLANPREIIREAVRINAARIIVAHNHPSQDPTPSEEDLNFTKRLSEATKTVGIALLDHIIICEGWNFFSFASAKLV